MIRKLKAMMPCQRRQQELDEELAKVREEGKRETEQQKAIAAATVQTIRRLKKDVPPNTVLREIANLQKFIREETDR